MSHNCHSLVRFSDVVEFVELPMRTVHEEECFLEIVPSDSDSSSSTSEDDEEDGSFAGLKAFHAMIDKVERRRRCMPTRTENVGCDFLCAPNSSRILQRRYSKK